MYVSLIAHIALPNSFLLLKNNLPCTFPGTLLQFAHKDAVVLASKQKQ